MKEILKTSNNMGGLLKMWVVPANRYWLTKSVFAFQNPDEVFQIYCTPGTIQLKEPLSVNDTGRVYKTEVSGFIPENRKEVADAILEMDGKPFVILLLDGNGKYILAGTSFYPLRINPSLEQGKDTSDLAGTNISFEGTTIARSIIVDNPF
jgi:hypothetical protein